MRTSKEATRQAIINAAAEVFAAEGLKGATTRQISQAASINEATLFRHFANKDLLLEAVIEQMAEQLGNALAELEAVDANLSVSLRQFAGSYNRILESHEKLLRTFIGEGCRQPDRCHRIIRAAIQPFKEKLVAFFERRQQRGELRPDLSMVPAIDSFVSMIIFGMLRRTSLPLSYEPDMYLDHCVEIFLRGVQCPVTRPAEEPA